MLRYFCQRSRGYCANPGITEVTFTPPDFRRTIHSWFGSSGGGLPRRPEPCSGRFLLALLGSQFSSYRIRRYSPVLASPPPLSNRALQVETQPPTIQRNAPESGSPTTNNNEEADWKGGGRRACQSHSLPGAASAYPPVATSLLIADRCEQRTQS